MHDLHEQRAMVSALAAEVEKLQVSRMEDVVVFVHWVTEELAMLVSASVFCSQCCVVDFRMAATWFLFNSFA